jgi:hypothetical protein
MAKACTASEAKLLLAKSHCVPSDSVAPFTIFLDFAVSCAAFLCSASALASAVSNSGSRKVIFNGLCGESIFSISSAVEMSLQL